MWEAHTKTGYYIGNSLEHYKCHNIWIVDTPSAHLGHTLYFKDKYPAQPSVTPLNAVLCISDYLCQILNNLQPVKGNTTSCSSGVTQALLRTCVFFLFSER
jgi:hypothetical protein